MCSAVNRVRLLFAAVLFGTFAAPAFAQQRELDALAAKVAARLSNQKKTVLVVPDFTVAKVGEHPLGAAVTKEFLASLRRADLGLKIIDQETLTQTAQRLNFLPMDSTNPLAVQAAALEAGAEVSVTGVISTDGRRTTLGIHITDLRSESDPFASRLGTEIGTIQMPCSLTPEWEQLRKQPAADQENGIYRIRVSNGITPPQCVKCPNPDFTKLARTRGTEGIVSLLITVTLQGETRDIAVLKHVRDGLTEAAVEAVRQWKFKPGHLRNGTAVPVRVKINVTFRMEI